MIHVLVPFVLALAGDHAALHPADAELYIEVPDIQGLMQAYPKAPIAQFLTDDELERFVAGIAGEEPEGFHLDERALDALQAGIASADPRIAEALPLLAEARALSFSIVMGAAPGRSAEPSPADGEPEPEEEPSLELSLSLDGARPMVAIEFASAEAAGAASGALAGLLGAQAEGGAWQAAIPIGAAGTDALWCELAGPVLVVGLHPQGRAEFHARREEPERSLARSSDFLAGRQHLRLDAGVAVYECYVRKQLLPERTFTNFDEPSMQAFGVAGALLLPGFEYRSHTRTRLVGERFVDETWSSDSPAGPGLGDAFGHAPIGRSAFDLLPANAVGAWVSSVDRELLHRELVSAIELGYGRPADEVRAEWAERYGFDPLTDLVGAVGARVAVYMLPITGLTLPKFHVALDLADPAAFERGIEGLGRMLAELSGGELELRSRPYRNQPVYTFASRRDIGTLAGELGAPMEFASLVPNIVESEVALTIFDGRAIFGLGDQGVKREIKRLLTADGEGRHPLAEGALASGAFAVPEEATSVGYLDWGTIVKGLYDTVRAFVPLIAQAAEDLPFDLSNLPEAEVFTRHWRPTLSWSVRREGGTYSVEESSFGPEMLLGLLGGGGFAVGTTVEPSASLEGPSQPTAEVRPREVPDAPKPPPPPADPLQATRDQLLDLKLALVVYKTDQGAFPSELKALLEPTERFPSGFLEADTSFDDAWGRALRYERGEGGASFLLWSLGADGVDERGGGDDASIR